MFGGVLCALPGLTTNGLLAYLPSVFPNLGGYCTTRPAFFKEMWTSHRIARITYHKHPKEDWPEDEFSEMPVRLSGGETVPMMLAQRGSWIGSMRDGIWVREVRKLNPDSHQTSLISTAYEQSAFQGAGSLMSRWSQENFFRYMMQHYETDLSSECQTK